MNNKQNYNRNKDMILDAAVQYEMDEMETKAFKILLLWQELAHKYFPDTNHGNFKKGDPRKSLQFKICYKLVRETCTYLEEKDYKLYVRAQLEIMKHFSNQNGNKGLFFDINCLVGTKAWKRWLVWKKKYDTKINKPKDFTKTTLVGERKALAGIQSTRDFMEKTFGLNYSIVHLMDKKSEILDWINFGKISPYYIVLSPWIQQILTFDDLKKLNFDPKFYEECITKQVEDLYHRLFHNEISTA